MATPVRSTAGIRQCYAATALVVAVLAVGCASPTPRLTGSPVTPEASSRSSLRSANALPSPTLADIPTVTPRPSYSERPDAPGEGSLATEATADQDGIALTMRLSSHPVRAGAVTSIAVEVVNGTGEILEWTNDGCDRSVDILAPVDAKWRPSEQKFGAELLPYREWFRDQAGVEDAIQLDVYRSLEVGRFGGCADLGLTRTLEPGASITETGTSDGTALYRLGPAPSGPVTWTAVFDRWKIGSAESTDQRLEVSLPGYLLGGAHPDALSPPEVIDIALADPQFASRVVSQPLRRGADTLIDFDPEVQLWTVGMVVYNDPTFQDPSAYPMLAAYIDPWSGEVLAVRETFYAFSP